MDRFDEIGLSKIASILDKQKIMKTRNNSTWERILSNSGQSSLYKTYSESLNPYSYNGIHQNKNYGFDEFYSAIKKILATVYKNGESPEEFYILVGSIIAEINLIDILNEQEVERNLRYYDDEEEFIKEHSDSELQEIINSKANEDYLVLVNNLRALNMDISVLNKKLKLAPFTQQSEHVDRNPAHLFEWLNSSYPEIANSYKEAIDNYIDGKPVSCISNCRNIVTGIFTNFKNDGNKKWEMGLKNLSTDKNIENVNTPANIMQGSANKGLAFENDRVFNYPRFKLIYQLYSTSSDLGPHSTEGQLIPEVTSLNDALLVLRMTEDVLIWVKERLNTYNKI